MEVKVKVNYSLLEASALRSRRLQVNIRYKLEGQWFHRLSCYGIIFQGHDSDSEFTDKVFNYLESDINDRMKKYKKLIQEDVNKAVSKKLAKEKMFFSYMVGKK